MTRTPASRRAYRRALGQKAPESAKDAPGTPNAPAFEETCVECGCKVTEGEESDFRNDLHFACLPEYDAGRADDYCESAYDRMREERDHA